MASFFGLTFSSGTLGGNLFVTTSLFSLAELPAYLLVPFLCSSRLGRTGSLAASLLSSGVVLLSMAFLGSEGIVLK